MWKLVTSACILTLALSGTAFAATGQQISVNGTGAAAVPNGATNAQQQAAYSRALSAAVTDAQAKARAVAQQLSLTLGAVQSMTELSNDYLGYCGIGFVSAPAASRGVSVGSAAPVASAVPNSQLKPIPPKSKKHKHKKKAHKAQSSGESSCQVEADVTLVYAAG